MRWLYAITHCENVGDLGLVVNIVSEEYWNKHKHIDDHSITDQIGTQLPNGFREIMESVFEFDGERGDAEAALNAAGFIASKEFADFCQKMEERW